MYVSVYVRRLQCLNNMYFSKNSQDESEEEQAGRTCPCRWSCGNQDNVALGEGHTHSDKWNRTESLDTDSHMTGHVRAVGKGETGKKNAPCEKVDSTSHIHTHTCGAHTQNHLLID